MRRLRGPHSLRARLFVGIAATLAVVDDRDARGRGVPHATLARPRRAHRSLDRQVELIAAQHAANPAAPRRHRRSAASSPPSRSGSRILTPEQAELLLPAGSRSDAPQRRGSADGTVDVQRRAVPVRSAPRQRRRARAAPLRAQPVRRLEAIPRRPRARRARRRRPGRDRRLPPRAGRRPAGHAGRGSEPAARGGREPRPAPGRGLDGAASALDRVQRALGGAPPRSGRGARVPPLRQPRAEDAADRDPRARRGARRRRRRAGAGRRGDRARGAPAGAPDPRPARPRAAAATLVRRHARCRVDLGEIASEALARHGLQAAGYGVDLVLRVEPPRRRRSRTPVACCRRSRTSSRTRSAAPPKAARSRSSPLRAGWP